VSLQIGGTETFPLLQSNARKPRATRRSDRWRRVAQKTVVDSTREWLVESRCVRVGVGGSAAGSGAAFGVGLGGADIRTCSQSSAVESISVACKLESAA